MKLDIKVMLKEIKDKADEGKRCPKCDELLSENNGYSRFICPDCGKEVEARSFKTLDEAEQFFDSII